MPDKRQPEDQPVELSDSLVGFQAVLFLIIMPVFAACSIWSFIFEPNDFSRLWSIVVITIVISAGLQILVYASRLAVQSEGLLIKRPSRSEKVIAWSRVRKMRLWGWRLNKTLILQYGKRIDQRTMIPLWAIHKRDVSAFIESVADRAELTQVRTTLLGNPVYKSQ